MLLSRDELISVLFIETDRAQRMRAPLAVILCGVDGPEGLRSHPDTQAADEAVREIARRTARLLRCYDSVGRWSDGEFALVLPGCNSFSAASLADRVKTEIFHTPVTIRGEEMDFTGCFGVAGSGGRSPFVVLRDAERALGTARVRGVGSIERCNNDAEPDPELFLIPVIEDEALHW